MTLRYPEQKLDLEGPGYRYDPRTGTGLPGFKGRHILYMDKCTGCQLCAIACDGVAVAIEMQHLTKGKPQNKKDIWPALDYGRCLPTWTPIVTSNGIVPIERIHVGDRVLTHTGKFRRVSHVFRRDYTGRIYTFRTLENAEPLTVTEGHPILVHTPEGLKWRMPDQIEYRTYLTRPIIKETLVLPELQYSHGLNYSSPSRGYSTVSLHALQFAQGHSHDGIRMTEDMILSPVIDISVKTVADLEVMNLEVEEDNSFVASNQVVHNCVFCGLCIDPDTPVMTNPGLKTISEISIGEKVLTHSGTYKPVTKIWDMLYDGPMYKISVYGKPEPLVCTADHPILAVSRPFSKKKDRRLLRVTEPLEFLKPGELKRGDYLVMPIVSKVVATEVYEKEVSMYREGSVKRRLALSATPELFRLIGYYLAEGSSYGGRVVNFDFNERELETFAKDCAYLVRKFFGKECASRKNGKHGVRLVLYSALAEEFFSQFGRGAPNKCLPDWVFFAEREKQLELLKGEWQGDGCRVNQARQKYLNITTTSKVLAFQLQSLYARLGIVSTIDSQHLRNRHRSYHVNVFGRWAIKLARLWKVQFGHNPSKSSDKFHINDRYVFMPIRRIEVEEVKQHRVMDVTVEEEHTFAPLGLATKNCVDACPFDALFMTNDFELSTYDKPSLKYSPDQLAIPPKTEGFTFKVKIDPEKGTTTHG